MLSRCLQLRLHLRPGSTGARGFLSGPTDGLKDAVLSTGGRRAFLVRDGDSVRASHPALQPAADWLADAGNIDYLDHEAVFLEVGEQSGLLMGAFLWNTTRGQGCGGIRLVPYDSAQAYLRDGLRLSTGMGRKSALAGLWWGGGKGVIARPSDESRVQGEEVRRGIFGDYGRFLTGLQGCYVAAEDSGVCVADVDMVFAASRHTTCISPALGGSGNPSVPTAKGVAVAIQAALEWQGSSVEGASVAVQGLGNVGGPLVGYLLEMGAARVVGADSSAAAVEAAQAQYAGQPVEFRLAARGDNSILNEDVDVVAPCALGSLFDAQTVGQLNCRVVCGAANNQLVDPDDDSAFTDRGIVYVPDFVANRMGIVNCADEEYGQVGTDRLLDPAVAKHFARDAENSVHQIVQHVLTLARDSGTTPGTAANSLADEMLEQPHPIFPDRPRQIIASLTATPEAWARA